MKVILVNGSTRENGCTFTALSEVAKSLNEQGIETEIFQVGKKPVAGCLACNGCSKTKKCVIDDCVNEFLVKAETADGFVFGSPVYYAAASGSLTSFLNRAFYGKKNCFEGKVGAAVASCRRGGASATLDQINKYFTIAAMPIVSSQYWNMVHGSNPDEVKKDLEGMQTMRTLGNNMAWLMKCIDCGRKNGIDYPTPEPSIQTNFIR